MLQPLVRVSYIPVLRQGSFKEFFCFFYFPDAQAGCFVDLMLKKNRHSCYLRFLLYDFRFIIAEI